MDAVPRSAAKTLAHSHLRRFNFWPGRNILGAQRSLSCTLGHRKRRLMARWATPETIAGAIRGDENAVDKLIAAVWPQCYRLAATVIGDRNLAQDAAQESCVVVYRKIRSVRDVGAFDAWLYRVVMRESARVRRRSAKPIGPTLGEPTDTEPTSTVDIWRALNDLSTDLRDVVVLFYFDDLKSVDIAAILGIAHTTVRTRLGRARARLRGLLDDDGDTPLDRPREVQQHAF
ncbi:MAG TPA: RNA polymerase sigma factor [Candidatus Eremiobacteraceae bacterium]